MYFNDHMFHPQYVNPQYYQSLENQYALQYQQQQTQEIANAIKAVHDLCEAIKRMDNQSQKIAVYGCLAEMAKEFNW